MNENILKHNVDKDPSIIEDILPDQEILVYPYEMPNAKASEEFVGNQTTSIVYISQSGLSTGALKDDGNGNLCFGMYAAITSTGKLDLSSSTSTLGLELKEEDGFTSLSNWFYDGKLENVKLGNLSLVPVMFTIGKPFDLNEYNAGNQPVYLSTSMIEAKDGATKDMFDIKPEGLYEFKLGNVTVLEAQFTNCKIMFTEDNIKEDVLTPDNGNGIRVLLENHTLIGGIKGKGKVTEFNNGVELESEFGDIEMITKQPLAPFKMTPIDTEDKVTMFADWFDYDSVMPYVFASRFKGGAKLDTILTNIEDRKMVEDMIVVSDAFANSFAYAPRLLTGTNAGKIDPTYRLGWSGLKVEALENKDPIKVIDGIYETHIRKHIAFEEDALRYRPVREVINALSRYIYSSYAIGKGQNAFNEAYLPWVLKPFGTTPIETVKESISNPDPGGTGDVDSYRLKDGVLFQSLSSYFRKKYSDNVDLKKTNELIIPESINLSNVKLLQTDRKLTVPTVGSSISAITKLPLPGDISTTSSKDLSYIWYLPINDQAKFEEFMLNTLETHTSVKPGEDLPKFLIPDSSGRGVNGKVWTQGEANTFALKMHPGALKIPPLVTQVKSSVPGWRISVYITGADGGQMTLTYNGHKIWNLQYHNLAASYEEIAKEVQKQMGYEDLSSITVPHFSMSVSGGHTATVGLDIQVSHSEFQEAVVTSSLATTIKSFSFEGREVLFDKQQWQKWINTFGIIPTKFITYDLLEINDFKIKSLDELIINYMWGNFVELQFGGSSKNIRVELFNSRDETLTSQRIIFS